VSFGSGIGEPLDDDLLTLLTHHVVVPAAVIAMVASLLSYLVDVRSAFLGGGPQLEWIGFCFAVATVLIERYGHTQGDREIQGCYTGALGVATVAVLLMEPWETRAVGLGERLANLLIVAAVWWLATRVTRGLSPEAGRPAGQGLRLYGLERLRIQAWQRQKAGETGTKPTPVEKPAPAIPANPAVSIARLAALALVAFALGEPVLLGAAPQTGVRALAAVVVFLFATGIVLAAGSALDALRRSEWAGGTVSPGLVPGRVAAAGALLVVVLAAGLAVPGLHFQGSGRLRPPGAHGQGAERDRGAQEGDQGEGTRRSPSDGKGRNGSESNPREGRDAGDRPAELTGPAADLVRMLTSAGKWLLIPLVMVLALAGLWALSRLLPRLAGWGGKIAERWRRLLDRLRALLGGFHPARRTGWTGGDPLANLERLALLPPRDAVLAAYHRFLDLLESRGHSRPAKSTPYEILNALPAEFRGFLDSARTLTDLYVAAAYSAEPVEHDAGERAIGMLRGMRGLPEKAAA
jgi:Domain of unknown function (DUF4129)